MRIAIISDSMTMYTGFGKQTRLLAHELFNRGHEVLVISPMYLPWENQDFSNGPVEWGVDYFFDQDVAASMLREAKPDVAIAFRDVAFIRGLAERADIFSNCRTLFWLADENEKPSPGQILYNKVFPDKSVMPVSQAVADCLPESCVAGVVLHGMDFDSLPKFEDRKELRKKWSNKLSVLLRDDDIILVCAERNDARKNWDAVYAVLSGVVSRLEDRSVVLLEVTTDSKEIEHFHRPVCREFYDVRPNCIDVREKVKSISDLDVYELLKLSDLRISCSGSEGFGLLTLEAASIKVPQVVSNVKSYKEIIGDSRSLVPVVRLALHPSGSSTYFRGKAYGIPDVAAMAERCVEFIQNPEIAQEAVEKAYEFAKEHCSLPFIVDEVESIIKNTPAPKLNRWGVGKAASVARVNDVRSLVYILQNLLKKESIIVELGSWDSEFLVECHARYFNPIGVVFEEPSDRVRYTPRIFDKLVRYPDSCLELPDGDTLVITDSLAEFAHVSKGIADIGKMLASFSKYEFVVLRNEPDPRWEISPFDTFIVEDALRDAGMFRRIDMESVVASAKRVKFSSPYQIWARTEKKGFMDVNRLWSSGPKV